MNKYIHGMLVTLTASVAAIACAGREAPQQDETESSALVQGVTVLGAQAGIETRIAFKKDDRVVYIEMRRGEATPEEVRNVEPDRPLYGTDLRITDRSGFTIYTRVAGAETEFDTDSTPPQSGDTAERHAQDSAVAAEALTVSTGVLAKMGKGFDAERSVIGEVATIFEAGLGTATEPADSNDVEAAELSPALKPLAEGAAAASQQHGVWLWKARCCVPGGWHSATRVANKRGDKWVDVKDQCNHGRCPHGEDMKMDCSYKSGQRSNSRKTGHCNTGYMVSSMRGHNCNDDSHLQVINVRHNKSHSEDDGSCHDIGGNPDPDGCDPNTW